jgi:hypothetical protein
MVVKAIIGPLPQFANGEVPGAMNIPTFALLLASGISISAYIFTTRDAFNGKEFVE